MNKPKLIPSKEICDAESMQVRASTDYDLIADYADAMDSGAKFPPVELFTDGKSYFIGDGFHRVRAAQRDNRKILANVRKGTVKDALLFALSANTTHGKPRTNADKRRAVVIAIEKFKGKSDRAIAQMCAVSAMLVGDVRKEANCKNLTVEPTPRTGRDGKVRRMPKRKATKRPASLPEPKAPEPEPKRDQWEVVFEEWRATFHSMPKEWQRKAKRWIAKH